MGNAEYEIGESPEPEIVDRPRKVTLSKPCNGTVYIKVNDKVVAGFIMGSDHLELYKPSTSVTGLVEGENGLLKVR